MIGERLPGEWWLIGTAVDQWFHELVKIVLFFVVQLFARLHRETYYRPHVLDVSGLVWFCDALQYTCNGLSCHCHAANVEIAAALLWFMCLVCVQAPSARFG